MSNSLATVNPTSMVIWDDNHKLEEIRKLFAPKLSETEFQIFVGLGKSTGLNPFLKELWAVKYGKDKDGNELPAQIFIGRDGYRKAAQAHSDYDYHQADAVYENDKFEVVEGEVQHSYSLSNRGKLMGAYCVVKRHKASRPQYVFAELDEYSTGQSLWAEISYKDNKYGGKYKVGGKPATMIKKVAEAQALRMCFQDLLGGTYGEEEYEQDSPHTESKSNKSESLLDRLKSAKCNTVEGEVVDAETGESATPEELEEIHALRSVKVFDAERLKGALEHYKVETLAQLTSIQAKDFINILNKCADKE